MRQVNVQASRNYSVTIGHGILSMMGVKLRDISKAKSVCIISDSNVWPIYGQAIRKSLEASGFFVSFFLIPPSEKSKNPETYLKLLNHLSENGLTREDYILALGGGVVGDLAGFAAATYLRGIPYIQLPTTLLAMVDASVGGKTGIDLPAGKNLCGAFYQPTAVICDLDTLQTLPEDVFRDGCTEVIKYGILYDPALFSSLEENGLSFPLEEIISRCVECKRNAVEADEFDTGARMLLNLGHTIGHAIETYSDYSISHGKAVSIGMAMISRASNCPDTGRIISLLQRFGLPTSTDIPAKKLAACALADKKRSGNTFQLIIPRAIGNCVIVPTPVDQMKSLIEAGL